MCVPVPLKKVL